MADDDNELTPQERGRAFERARRLVERVNEVFEGTEDEDVFLALQLLQAKFLVRTGMDHDAFMSSLNQNLPRMRDMWEKANIDAETGSAQLFAPAGHRIDSGGPGSRGSA